MAPPETPDQHNKRMARENRLKVINRVGPWVLRLVALLLLGALAAYIACAVKAAVELIAVPTTWIQWAHEALILGLTTIVTITCIWGIIALAKRVD
jgi:hypothetical protein